MASRSSPPRNGGLNRTIMRRGNMCAGRRERRALRDSLRLCKRATEQKLFTMRSPAGRHSSDSRQMSSSWRLDTFSAVLVGAFYGVFVAGLAFIIAGGGHGWNSSLLSGAALLLVPLAGFAWSGRRRTVAAALVAAGGFVDVAIVVATAREGFEYVERIFAALPLVVIVWAALWLSWQIGLTLSLFGRAFRRHADI
jgi:hypothetical protein